jgi:DNA-binding GntR family transcriptional regulator
MRHLTLERSLTDRTYDAILDAICGGELAAGARINQDELAARLNVSRQPIVQALALLKVQGFVRETGRRGYYLLCGRDKGLAFRDLALNFRDPERWSR